MAIPKRARVTAVRELGPDTRLLDLDPDEPFPFIGGQYVIVDSGLVLPSGKAVKRAYSFVSSDAAPSRFQLAVKRIAGGLGSGYVHGLDVGAEVSFSGPWGKLFPAGGASGRTWIFATDTGVSAALGLVQSERMRPLLPETVFVWSRATVDYFVPEAFVRERIPAQCGAVRIETGPGIGHPERVAYARAVLARDLANGGVSQVFICGDGALNYALLDALAERGVAATRDNVESFFNMPKKSA